jgi:SAM-dependent methyltransferase
MGRLDSALFVQNNAGVFVPPVAVKHSEEAFESAWYDILRDVQTRHFWSRGRQRFLLHSVRRFARELRRTGRKPLSAIDLGGGCGGWIRHLRLREPSLFDEVALGDSGPTALEYARDVVGPEVDRYQVDLLDLPWTDRWDVVFLLDVLEHIREDSQALRQIQKALRPGGYLFVTTPAFNCFWTYNDDVFHHLRRYVRRDFVQLAASCDLELAWSRYFMFLLSPLLLLSRLGSPKMADMSEESFREWAARTQSVPSSPLNFLLGQIFNLETPLGAWLPFPWGTSILGVFRKPG